MNLNGIQRNSPQGTLIANDEQINLRYNDGALQPVGPKAQLYPKPPYDLVILHRMDSATNFIGYDHGGKTVFWYHPGTLNVNQTIVALSNDENLVHIKHLKLFLLIVTDKKVYRMLYKEGTYLSLDLTDLEAMVTVSLQNTDVLTFKEAEPAPTAAGILGKYFKLLNEQSALGRLNGGLFYRTALKMFDGTEIMHSLPKYYQISNHNGQIFQDGTNWHFKLDELAGIAGTATFNEILHDGAFENLKNVITSVVLYASRSNPLYEINEITVTDDILVGWVPTPNSPAKHFRDAFQVSENFKAMDDATVWYKIGEVALADMVQNQLYPDMYSAPIKMDLKSYYENYATRQQIQIDNFTHHQLTGKVPYMYNSRLHLGDTVQTLSKIALSEVPDVAVGGGSVKTPYGGDTVFTYTPHSVPFVNAKFVFTINTTDGIKYAVQDTIINLYATNQLGNGDIAVAAFLPSLIGYFDTRATYLSVYINYAGTNYKLLSSALKASVFQNFAYLSNRNFDPQITQGISGFTARRMDGNFVSYPVYFRIVNGAVSDIPAANTIPADNRIVLDGNRLQPSLVSNPFVFPAVSSVQVSTGGTVTDIGSNSEDVSDGQYGQYPLYCFTTLGIYGLEIGAGSVYITKVDPLSGEVIKSYPGLYYWQRNSKLDLPFGIAFVSFEGVKIISGKEVVLISDAVRGLPDRALTDNPNLQYFINHARLVELADQIDQVSFPFYLQGAGLYLNKAFERSELIVSNPLYPYSYVYDIVGKYWYKMKGTYSLFIPSYPELWAVDDVAGKVVNISVETTGQVQCLLLTRALPMDAPEYRKKMRRSFLRCQLTIPDNFRAAGYVFESDNLKQWKFVTGNDRNFGEVKDIWITHSMHSARFYAYLYLATVSINTDQNINYIGGLDVEFDLKSIGKLR